MCIDHIVFSLFLHPGAVVLYMRRRGEISELFIPERRDRLRPLFFYFASSWVGCWCSVSDTLAARAVRADGLCRRSGHCRAVDNGAVENQLTRHGALGCLWWW